MNTLVTKLNDKRDWLSQQAWTVPVCFGLTCALTLMSVVLAFVRGLSGMSRVWMFTIGADIFCIAVCTMLCFSAVLNRKRRSADTYIFVTLLTVNAMALFADECCWLVQGIATFRTANIIANVFFYMLGSVLIFLFWKYIRRALKLRDKPMQYADIFVTAMLFPSLALGLVNFFYPLYFSVDVHGVYSRTAQWDVSAVYLGFTLSVVILAIAFAQAPAKDRLVAVSFIGIPLLNQVVTSGVFGLSTQYAAMTVSIVLIYGVLFAEHENALVSTEMELDVATKIQADMLPSTFPFMPERREFDLYASMTPAKEVGGDFYDFFMVDDNHLALVIADVSGKGVPAALFMMASKILIKNSVMTGKSPGEVLRTVNNQICENNREEMFVTVWLGILNLTDGMLISANAGHEYPALKKPGGDFELIKSKHSFVVGGIAGIKYRETQMKVEPGAKLFLYTDGVPEAETFGEKQYGYERFLSALNREKNGTPQELLAVVENDISAFVQSYPQFDDLTMLCVHYIGKDESYERVDR